jgi:hypothetical protein
MNVHRLEALADAAEQTFGGMCRGEMRIDFPEIETFRFNQA